MSGKINIEAAYAFPAEQTLSKQSVPEWVTFAEAIRLCSLLERHPEADPAANKPCNKEVRRMRAEEGNFVEKDGGKT